MKGNIDTTTLMRMKKKEVVIAYNNCVLLGKKQVYLALQLV